MSRLFTVFSSIVVVGVLFASQSLASMTECSTANAKYQFKQFQSDGGVPPTPEMIKPHWFQNGAEDLTMSAEVDESSRIIVAKVICPTWNEHSENECLYNEIDYTVKMRLYGAYGNARWAADVIMLCHQTKYVGPPIP